MHGHIPATRCLLLLTQPYSSILPSIFFTCLPSNHIPTYTRPHKYPNNLPNPNITSLTSSFNSSQLPASHTSTTSSQISFNLNPNSPFSFLKHPQYILYIFLVSASHRHRPIHFNFPYFTSFYILPAFFTYLLPPYGPRGFGGLQGAFYPFWGLLGVHIGLLGGL